MPERWEDRSQPWLGPDTFVKRSLELTIAAWLRHALVGMRGQAEREVLPGLPGEHDAHGLGSMRSRIPEDGNAVDLGHVRVRDDDIERLRLQPSDGLRATDREVHVPDVSLAAKEVTEPFENARLVVDEEDATWRFHGLPG